MSGLRALKIISHNPTWQESKISCPAERILPTVATIFPKIPTHDYFITDLVLSCARDLIVPVLGDLIQTV